ncbi:hypothetical protein PAMA110636_20700 [Paenibacillus macerans]
MSNLIDIIVQNYDEENNIVNLNNKEELLEELK